MADKAIRAHGRSLKDFEPLWPAEQTLLEACRTGEWAEIAEERPEAETDQNRVRAGFVRFLALGGDARAPVHEHGVQLEGAWLVGALELGSAEVQKSLKLARCRISRIEAWRAKLPMLNLSGSCLEAGLLGDGLRCEGDLVFRDGFLVNGEVRLLGAYIGGDLDCEDGRFIKQRSIAISCDGADIKGNVFFRGSFYAAGGVRLVGASVGGDLDFSGGRVENEGRDAVSLDRLKVAGTVFMRLGFCASGEVRMLAALIGGTLSCRGGRFQNPTGSALSADIVKVVGGVSLTDGFRAAGAVRFLGVTISGNFDLGGGHFENGGANALSLDGAKIDGALFFRDVAGLVGGVDLAAAHVGTLCDDAASWRSAAGRLALDGFTYGRLAGFAPTDAATRIAWLMQQRPDFLKADFRPQPWEQLVKVLREMGHPNEARQVAIEKQKMLRRAGRVKPSAWPFHWLYGLLVGYGYLPVRLLGFMAAAWLAFAVLFHGTWALAEDPAFVRVRGAALAAETSRPPFVPGLYSLDALLPIDLGQQQLWRPAAPAMRLAVTVETIFGWIASLLLLAVLGNLVKKD